MQFPLFRLRERGLGGESLNILIIGGTGLISTAITRQLLERGGATVYHYNRGQRAGEAFAGQVLTIHGDRYNRAGFVQHMRACRQRSPSQQGVSATMTTTRLTTVWGGFSKAMIDEVKG